MISNRKAVLKSVNDYFHEVEQCLDKLNQQLELVSLEKDFYKQQVYELQEDNKDLRHSLVHMVVYSEDNGEGSDTEICLGVFTRKSYAIKAILDICKKHTELDTESYNIVEIKLDKHVRTNDVVYVVQQDVEAHCEISTSIIGVQFDNTTNNKEYYTVEYKLDDVYCIEA